MQKQDSIIALARPQTYVYKNSMRYDAVFKFFGICKGNTYKAGHAAAILVHHDTWALEYYDFGRYIMPHQFGRVRDAVSDPDVTIPLPAEIDTHGNITNLKQILSFAAHHEPFHGEGKLYASVYRWISASKAKAYAKKLQNKWKIHYGPFELRGTNCSRFVNEVFRAGKPHRKMSLRLLLCPTITPMTKHNIIVNRRMYVVDTKTLKDYHLDRLRIRYLQTTEPLYMT